LELSNIKNRIDVANENLTNLLDYANAKTEKSDTDIGEAIRTLVDGYGQGGGDKYQKTIEVKTNSTSNIFVECPFEPKVIHIKRINEDALINSLYMINISLLNEEWTGGAVYNNASGGRNNLVVTTQVTTTPRLVSYENGIAEIYAVVSGRYMTQGEPYEFELATWE